MISTAIQQLVNYGLDTGLILPDDEIYIRNQLLMTMQLDDFTAPEGEVCYTDLESILKTLVDDAVARGVCATMDHPNQNTMLLPASYAVISEEEMTYLDGGQSIYLGSAFNHDIYFNTDQFATFCQNAAINLFVLMTNYSFRYIAGRVQSGLSNGLSLSGTFYHTWDKMNTWSRIASVGVAGLAGVYVYSQVMNVIRTVTSIYDQIVNPMPSFDAAQAEGTAAA